MFRSSINLLLILLVATTVSTAQKLIKQDTVSRYQKFMPTGIRFGTDAMAFARTMYTNTFSGWEASADVDLDRYFVVMEYGQWSRVYTQPDQYDNDGRYFRAGVDVNFLTNDPQKNAFFIGARYGRSTFSEHLVISDTDEIWGPISSDHRNTNVNGNWFELTTGLKVKMWKWFWMGYTARFKFGLSTNETGLLIPHDVPGYGRTDQETTWGFNYQLFFRIPVRTHKNITKS